MMHVEKLRLAIGFHALEAGIPTRLIGTFSMSLPGHMESDESDDCEQPARYGTALR